jgi:CRP-like cAMP-binding protein
MDLVELFRNDANFKTVNEGEPVFHAGDPGEQMFVLVQGQADILVGGELVESAGPGAIFGEMALVDSGPRSATVVARSECRVLPIDIERFNAMIQKTPEFAQHVMGVMADRIRSMNGRTALLMEHILRF